MKEISLTIGPRSLIISRIVRNGQVFFSNEYTWMVKRNASVVLLSNADNDYQILTTTFNHKLT